MDALHGIVHVAAWVSRAEEAQFDQAQRAQDFPQAVADKINLPTLRDTVAPEGRRGRPPFAVQAMLRIHFMQ